VRKTTMLPASLRTLMLACSLLLALPPGWCCMVRAGVPTPAAEKAAPHHCPCCPCQGTAKPKAPEPHPLPLPPAQCPCDGRQATAPDATKASGDNLTLAAPPPVIDLVPTFSVDGDIVALPFFPSHVSLQLLHRVWLC
jgi:hypothetical protein